MPRNTSDERIICQEIGKRTRGYETDGLEMDETDGLEPTGPNGPENPGHDFPEWNAKIGLLGALNLPEC